MEKPYWKKIKCIRAKTPYYTVGKVYDVTDEGYVVDNEGDLRLTKLDYTSTFSGNDYSLNSNFEEYIEDPNVFPAGSYVVLLASCNGGNCWSNMPINHCYKLRNESATNRFYPEVDAKRNTSNGWRYSGTDNSVLKLKLRAATPKEIAEYDRLGKPFDVTKMSDALLEEAAKRYPIGTKYKALGSYGDVYDNICTSVRKPRIIRYGDKISIDVGAGYVYVDGKWAEVVEEKEKQFKFGKWYEAKNTKGLYIKPLSIDSDGDVTSNVVWSNGEYNEIHSAIDKINDWNLLTDLSEIQQFLPDGHPDKFSIAKEESPLEICKKKYKAGMEIISTIGTKATLTQRDIDTIVNGESLYTKEYIYAGNGSYELYDAEQNKYAEIISEPEVSITLDDIKPDYWVKIIDDSGTRPEHWESGGAMNYLYGTWQQINSINKDCPLPLSIKDGWGLKLSDIVEVSQHPPFITKGEVVESGFIKLPGAEESHVFTTSIGEILIVENGLLKPFKPSSNKTNLLPTRKFRISKINY